MSDLERAREIIKKTMSVRKEFDMQGHDVSGFKSNIEAVIEFHLQQVRKETEEKTAMEIIEILLNKDTYSDDGEVECYNLAETIKQHYNLKGANNE